MTELFVNAAEIMLVGMGAVLAFLLLLIVVMALMGRLIPHPEPVPQRTPSSAPDSSHSDGNPSPGVVAAISVAVNRYRKTHRN
ncbi:oxaloacetate decarboxylase subunit gamma [Idiomarina sp. OT37-5b]|uniref:Probable oxaloacetate decarboxylase gamma chain n=1 Tax=Idiomarina aquatica TaxID=1327752 RepID=A0AA94EGC0_9GAMM|nr:MULTISPECIES: oxaloacetate decarboxylase subunit gamma [Idiomarina]AVJ56362.1 oxaloacetate decarboxylase subunit gamma [Idiomarina sp. OT37-5b]RUO43570.1 oxaloacetate decarboxylase subunit gamma [Idiomarina aquatica]